MHGDRKRRTQMRDCDGICYRPRHTALGQDVACIAWPTVCVLCVCCGTGTATLRSTPLWLKSQAQGALASREVRVEAGMHFPRDERASRGRQSQCQSNLQ